MFSKKGFVYILVALLGMLIGFLFFGNNFFFNQDQTYNKNFITNFALDKSKTGGDFTLTKHDNTPFSFSSLIGKPTLMYFGFTHCPDFCPTSLGIMDLVSKRIDINRVFITIDPERDTVDMLDSYVQSYQDGLIGLTGTIKETDKVAKQYMIYYSHNKQSDNDKNYTVDHTTYLYLLDKNGDIVAFIRPEATANEIITFIENSL